MCLIQMVFFCKEVSNVVQSLKKKNKNRKPISAIESWDCVKVVDICRVFIFTIYLINI